MITDNMRIDPRAIGLTGLLVPGLCHISGGRQDMVASHLSQPRVVESPDFPNIFTGWESIFGDYTFNSAKCDHAVVVIAIVNKYDMKIGTVKAGNNPMRTVIYRDLTTGEISYFELRRHTCMTNDFGYENIMRSTVQVGDVIPANSELYSSNAKDGDLYKLGVNANVAFITTLDTTEDSLVMSESIARKLSPMSIETKSINIDLKKYPLNLYGDDDFYKLIPDLGEYVNPDGILCGFRPVKRFSAMSDLRRDKLKKINHLFDQKVYAHPGAKVIDIEVYIDSKSNLPSRIYEQLNIYQDARLNYWQGIVDAYVECKHHPMSDKFNTLITKAMGRLLAAKRSVPDIGRRPKITLTDKFNPIRLRIDVTLAHRVTVNKGYKSTGREGAKGVIVKIRPDNEMPIDEQGFRADICIDPVSVLKRTNIFQLYEQYLNRVLKWQAMNLHQLGSTEAQFRRIIEILGDINPEYAKIVADTHKTEQQIVHYVEECKADTIKICIPPSLDNINKELIIKLDDKYKTPISPVEFTIMTSNGKVRVKTKEPVCIGAKYIYLLAKYPKPIAPGFGYVNQYHFPVGSKEKHGAPMGTTPIRFGEAESRVFATTTGLDSVLRLRCLFGNSTLGPKSMVGALMNTQSPSKLELVDVGTKELYDTNHSIRIVTHMMNTIGMDFQNSIITEGEAEALFDDLASIDRPNEVVK